MDRNEFIHAEKLSLQDRFRFSCDGCGKCCRDRGDIKIGGRRVGKECSEPFR